MGKKHLHRGVSSAEMTIFKGKEGKSSKPVSFTQDASFPQCREWNLEILLPRGGKKLQVLSFSEEQSWGLLTAQPTTEGTVIR